MASKSKKKKVALPPDVAQRKLAQQLRAINDSQGSIWELLKKVSAQAEQWSALQLRMLNDMHRGTLRVNATTGLIDDEAYLLEFILACAIIAAFESLQANGALGADPQAFQANEFSAVGLSAEQAEDAYLFEG